MKVAVAKLEAGELNYWVQRALGWKYLGPIGFKTPEEGEPYCRSGPNDWWESPAGHKLCGPCWGLPLDYSTDWARAGPIIEREKICVAIVAGRWVADQYRPGEVANFIPGPSPLIAAMRAFVRIKFGNFVEGQK